MMKRSPLLAITWIGLTLAGAPGVHAWVNPEVQTGSGASTELCDVRDSADSLENGTLRERLERFNAEVDANGRPTGRGECLFGIYFLDPMTVVLEEPLVIRAVETALRDGRSRAGTYISGLRQSGRALPVTLDARDITSRPGECAFLIEGGLNTFQQIHDLTVLTRSAERVVCDENGEDLLQMPIPPLTSRRCPAGALARDCDFKDLTVQVEAPVPEAPLEPDPTPPAVNPVLRIPGVQIAKGQLFERFRDGPQVVRVPANIPVFNPPSSPQTPSPSIPDDPDAPEDPGPVVPSAPVEPELENDPLSFATGGCSLQVPKGASR